METRTDERTRARLRRETVARLTESPDFRSWLYDALDDLCLYARDEGVVSEFGQGIRAAANRVKTRLLVARESVGMLADFERRALEESHAAIAAAMDDDEANDFGGRD